MRFRGTIARYMHIKRTPLLALVLTLGIVAQAAAAGIVTVEDTVAGLGADIRVRGLAPDTAYSATVDTPEGQSVRLAVRTDGDGEGSASVPSESTEAAGDYRVSVKDGSATLASSTFAVMPDSMDGNASAVRADRTAIAADGEDEATVTVTLRDRFGNALKDRPATLVSSRAGDMIYAQSQQTDAHGEQRFSVLSEQPGIAVLRAIDLLSGETLAATAQIQVGQAAVGYGEPMAYDGRMYIAQATPSNLIDRFVVKAPAEMQAGVDAPEIEVIAVDRNGRKVEGYIGSIAFSSTDPEANLPNFGRYTFLSRDLGSKKFALGLKFQLPGLQTLRVEDENDPSIFGETDISVIGRGSAGGKLITITSPTNGQSVPSSEIVLQGIGPALSNLIVYVSSGTMQTEIEASTQGNGAFSVPLSLTGGTQPGYSIFVEEASGRGRSDIVYVTIDQSGPAVSDARFQPVEPVNGDKTLAAINADQDAVGAKVRLLNRATQLSQELTLQPNDSAPGTFQAFFTATGPADYDATFVVTDALGNVTQKKVPLTVRDSDVPPVKNLRATATANSVKLEWDKGDDDITDYRVYIGQSPTDFGEQRQTGKPVTEAVVGNLKGGTDYYFAVTAIREGKESEKSATVTARTAGLSLEVEPGYGSLKVSWLPLGKEFPLSLYHLEYGVEEGTYTEKRQIAMTADTYTIGDLLNGVKYFVKLTPVAATGEALADLAATADGTPNGQGQRFEPTDELPFDPDEVPLHPGAPLTPSGIPPAWKWLGGLAVIGAASLWLKRRSAMKHQAAFLDAIQSRYVR